MTDTRIPEGFGVYEVAKIVQGHMGCGWQEFDARNDDSVDGVIIDRKDGQDTGDLYFSQVKCGRSYLSNAKKRPNHLGINLGEEHINRHRPRWMAKPGPMILIYVDNETDKAWWTDLKSPDSYCPEQNKQIVLIPREQRFGVHSIGHLRRLRSHVDLDRELDTLALHREDLVWRSFSKTEKEQARQFYREWAQSSIGERTNPGIGEILVSRVGWRHVTRSGRGADNITQSWRLLGAAKKIILTNSKLYQLSRPQIEIKNGIRTQHDHLSLRSRVTFPNRHESVVQVVIKRLIEIDERSGETKNRNWFYSVHEPRRGNRWHRGVG